MRWIAISGGWRKITPEIEAHVRKVVAEIMKRGDGIVSGGALGVDCVATDEALKHNPQADRIKIFIPASLEAYAAHYRQRAADGMITREQAEELIRQLRELKSLSPWSLVENMNNKNVTKDSYFERNADEVEAADELIAFPVKTEFGESVGTKDTIEKATHKRIPVTVYAYDLTSQQT